jgi:hypothetical protein
MANWAPELLVCDDTAVEALQDLFPVFRRDFGHPHNFQQVNVQQQSGFFQGGWVPFVQTTPMKQEDSNSSLLLQKTFTSGLYHVRWGRLPVRPRPTATEHNFRQEGQLALSRCIIICYIYKMYLRCFFGRTVGNCLLGSSEGTPSNGV